MNWLPPRYSLFAQIAFASVVLTVFALLTLAEALRGPPWRVVVTFALAVPYTILFSLLHPRLAARPSRGALPAYYAVQLLLVGAMILVSPSRGFFAIIVLPLVSQAIFDFHLRGAALVALAAYVPTVATWFETYGWDAVWRAVITYAPAFLFTGTFTLVSRRALEARHDAEQLARDLAAANDRLRAQAAQADELATTRERNRLAREIHDGVGHYLTTIKVQLDAAHALLPDDPARARDSVGKAARLAADALDDVRRSVHALAADTSRPPLLAALQRLAADGAPSPRIHILGTPRPVPTAVEHALFRAVQEGLTNLRKHAAARSADLEIDFTAPGEVRLALTDDGAGGTTPAPGCSAQGLGLRGLAERVALLGGRLSAGPRPAGGFNLEVIVPA